MSGSPDTSVLRILDAAFNRAGEGLRVVEEYLRMMLDDGHLAAQAKQLRHDMAAASAKLPREERHACRDTLGDVGAQNSTASETSRCSAADVATASLRRVAEAMRSIEEYGKLVDTELAADVEQLRYRLYTLEKAATLASDVHPKLADALLYVLVDGGTTEVDFRSMIESLAAAGVGAVQLRDKRLDDQTLLERARQLVVATANTSTLAIVNDRVDIALAARADGVHLGQDDLPVATARKLAGPRLLIGVSTHSIEQARQAVLEGANYLGAGPTFASSTKQFDSFPGLDFLRQVSGEVSLPTFAIGGITAENLPQVLSTGVRRIAVSGAITGAAEPAAAATQLIARLSHSSATKSASRL